MTIEGWIVLGVALFYSTPLIFLAYKSWKYRGNKSIRWE